MTNTGRPLDDLAKTRAEAVAAAIRSRGLREVRNEHTREVVRQDLPEELRALILENAQTATLQTIKIADLEHRIADLERALRDIAVKAKEQAERLAKASEAA